jgi:hypothetical protein
MVRAFTTKSPGPYSISSPSSITAFIRPALPLLVATKHGRGPPPSPRLADASARGGTPD